MEKKHRKQNVYQIAVAYPEFEHSTPLVPVLSLDQRAAQPKPNPIKMTALLPKYKQPCTWRALREEDFGPC
jgi:hypothetical protein